MAIATRTEGAWEVATPNASSTQFTIPTHQTGDLLLLRFFAKPYTITPSIDQGWTIFGNGPGGSNANGNGAGSVYGGFAYKIAASASETGPTVTWGVNVSPGFGVIDVYQKGASEAWVTPVGLYTALAAATSISVTMSSNPGITAGDLCVSGIGTNDNTTLTSPNFSATGVSWDSGTPNEWPATALSTATGNDGAGDGAYRIATTGTASAAPVVTGSNTAADEGVAIFARLRVQAVTTQSGSFVADAIQQAIQAGATPADSVVKATMSGTWPADAIFLQTIGPASLWVDAYLARVVSGQLSSDAIVLAIQSGQVRADAIAAVVQAGLLAADATLLQTIAPYLYADAWLQGESTTQTGSLWGDAFISAIGMCVWTFPDDGVPITRTPELRFLMPASTGNLWFWLELDRSADFNTADLRRYQTTLSVTDWTYWDGDSWESIPAGGVPNTFAGNEARFNVTTPLAGGTWFRRVRAGTR